jgi:hypothetical protein
MIESIYIKNFGPIAFFAWHDLAPINLVIGRHGTGKTFLLKILYCALRALEEKRGDEPRTHAEILADKLFWTFQPDRIGDLVRKGSEGELSVSVMLRDLQIVQAPPEPLKFSFGNNAERSDVQFESQASRPMASSIFLPAKEVLSLHKVILHSREHDRLFGFDETYVDLAKALRWQPVTPGLNEPVAGAMAELEARVGGRMESESRLQPHGIPIPQQMWRLKQNGNEFPVGMAAEGARKISTLYALFLNKQLDYYSIIFIDEPESALHPEAISAFLDVIIALIDLFQGKLQFFLASHSYFVVKKLYLIAQEKGTSIPIAMAEDDRWTTTDLKDAMPSNPIIDESIRLYKEEVELALK